MEESTPCAGCKAKGEGEVQAAVTIIVAGLRVWDVCQEHADRFGGYFADLFKEGGESAPVKARPSAVVTGDIPGYDHATARTAVENLGYRIVGHVDADTEIIVCGLRPAPHKVAEARELGTACMDATKPKTFALAIRSGTLPSGDELPVVQAKKTAEDVKAQVEAEAKWREEKNRRLGESSVKWAQERKAKDDEEIKRIVKAKLPPELTETQKIRAWAAEHGFELKAAGRIPASIREAYQHAHAGQESLLVVEQ